MSAIDKLSAVFKTGYVELRPKDYDWPSNIPSEYLPKRKPTVTINEDEIKEAAGKGVTWEQMENYYVVDKETLKKHFFILYNRERAKLEINVLDGMVTSALGGSDAMLKWLSVNWLHMTDKTITEIVTPDYDAAEVDEKIAKLMKKMTPDDTTTTSDN
jgi:hypothetical protein